VIRLRFGLDEQEAMTLQQIGERFQLSRARTPDRGARTRKAPAVEAAARRARASLD
jgi:DNA-directed RNA polymerase sigma subunit (sigma70/sigma32)